ncbi:MAG: phytanoyl-CoA dioxygenase family protein [Bacteroidota bacterium]
MMTDRLQQFKKDGFLIVENLAEATACDELIARTKELSFAYDVEGHRSIFQTRDQSKTTDDYFLNSGDKIAFFFEKDAFDKEGNLNRDVFHALNKVGHALHDLDPVFSRFSRSVQLQELAADLNLSHHVLIQSMLICKHARIGGEVDVHQDSTFLYTEPGSCIGFWFALEDATQENGCLWATPGGHQTSLRTRFRRKEGGGTMMEVLNDEPYAMDGMIPLEVKKGTCIVLDGLLPHYSLPNTSGRSRFAYAIHTVDQNCIYPADNWLQVDREQLKGFVA